ncbi:hypothetical protein HYW36_03405 [Candidatus Saccharibacteria bacterium]|nr:hypothetical protein [Candidatus Saccharibacteria bacterium]
MPGPENLGITPEESTAIREGMLARRDASTALEVLAAWSVEIDPQDRRSPSRIVEDLSIGRLGLNSTVERGLSTEE